MEFVHDSSEIHCKTTNLFSEDEPKDLLSSLAPLAVETVSTLPSKSKVVSKFSLLGSVGLKARGDLFHATLSKLKSEQNGTSKLEKEKKIRVQIKMKQDNIDILGRRTQL